MSPCQFAAIGRFGADRKFAWDGFALIAHPSHSFTPTRKAVDGKPAFDLTSQRRKRQTLTSRFGPLIEPWDAPDIHRFRPQRKRSFSCTLKGTSSIYHTHIDMNSRTVLCWASKR